MRTVDVRDLETHLSRILQEVRRGEVVLITDQGRLVAELRPPGTDPGALSRTDRARAELSASGALKLGEERADPYPVSPLESPAGSALSLLSEDRADS